MYIHEWIEGLNYPINVTSEDTFRQFLENNVTDMIYDTYSQIVSEDEILPITMTGSPVHNTYVQEKVALQILGIPLTYEDISNKFLLVTPEYEKR